MRRNNSLILAMADETKLPAGSALAVDREAFSQNISKKLYSHPLITIKREEISGKPPVAWENVIIATGPLTAAKFSASD